MACRSKLFQTNNEYEKINTLMKTLYIIGNGFDIHHKLDTRYQSFANYLAENNSVALPWTDPWSRRQLMRNMPYGQGLNKH